MKLFGMRNSQCLHFFLGLVLVILIFPGCSREPDTHKVSGNVTVRIPIHSEGGSYQLREVELLGIQSLYKLSGDYVTFYIYPSVKGTKIHGSKPKARFLKSGDVYVPEDVVSQQLAVIYAHFQRLAALDVELGAEGVNTWPRDIGVLVRYREDNGALSTNSAYYDPGTDAVLVVPYTQDNLPIYVNAGVLAHEHFHSLYQKLVQKHLEPEKKNPSEEKKLKRISDLREVDLEMDKEPVTTQGRKATKVQPEQGDDRDEYHALLSLGLNEGLADFWAWIYTGDPDFLQWSLPKERAARSLNLSEEALKAFVFPDSKTWRAEVANRFHVAPRCWGSRVSYCLGTKYAQMLKNFSGVIQDARGISSLEARKIVGAGVIKTLPLLKDEMLSNFNKEKYFEPYHFFSLLEEGMPDLKTEERRVLQKLVRTAATQNPRRDKGNL